MNVSTSDTPSGTFTGFRTYWRSDLLSGFLVFLIALPLCLGISLACGYPAIAGIFTAIIGGIVSTFFSNSELTIKGPAAGLIAIAIACVTDFGFTAGRDPTADFQAYRLALGVGVAAGGVQILFGLFRAGILGEFFPVSAVHGLLASIGVIIISKSIPVTLGVSPEGPPLELLVKIPEFVLNMNPAIGLIGIISLVIMFGYPFIRNPRIRAIPAPIVVLLITAPLGLYFEIGRSHTYTFAGKEYSLGATFLVDVPNDMLSAFTFPDFSGVATATGIKYIVLFALIGSLESLLSAKAVDQIDPWRRKTNDDRDLLAIGVGNTVAAFLGGLPMISEIVRSRANIDNGARTRFANMYHGIFLLVFVALAPELIDQIPLASLGAMLVYTGYRLASPHEFVRVYKVGREQLIIFVSTIIGVLATDLLKGIAIGILVKAVIHVVNRAPIGSLFRLRADVRQGETGGAIVKVHDSAIFSTWIGLKRKLESLRDQSPVVLDLSEAALVDHTVMEKLAELKKEFGEHDSTLRIEGLDSHRTLSDHPAAARVRQSRAGAS